MTRIPYTFAVIKYLNDPSIGESLNIGVILYSSSASYLKIKLEYKYERLSTAFTHFNGEQYRRSLAQLTSVIERFEEEMSSALFPENFAFKGINEIVAALFPDSDLSFQCGPVLAGIANDLDQAVIEIFNRFISVNQPLNSSVSRSDDEIWANVYHNRLSKKVTRALTSWTASSDDYTHKFDHAFKNESWHILHPTSMDYVRPDSIQKKATALLGMATAIQDTLGQGKLYILLGKPKLEGNQKAYVKAKNLLNKVPVNHELIEEHEAGEFADELAEYMKAHGVIKDSNDAN